MNDVFALLAVSATDQASILAPASPPAESIRDLSTLVIAIALGIFLVVEGVLCYCIVQFRRRRSEQIAVEPAQVYGSKPIEVAWTVAPALIVFTLVLVTARTLWEVEVTPSKPVPDDDTLLVFGRRSPMVVGISASALQRSAVGFVTANELHVPASDASTPRRVFHAQIGRCLSRLLGSRLAGKTDDTGRENSMWFQTTNQDCSWVKRRVLRDAARQHVIASIRR